ncbi:glutamate synthase-related protein [Pelosinus sp. IPA-1]|uniref:glutamate synthase-related protein n=1 Tax=Pelosinus sp. IPA-1 TaxID=3029569 RepID=UPI002555AD06|nr:glutamate synthase-related protein [Pelosinus sp. IPA-1]
MQIIINNYQWIYILLILLVLLLLGAMFLAKPVMRYIIKRVTNDALGKLLTDDYTQNIAELLPSLTRFSLLNLVEMSLRAQTGKALARPLGSPKHFVGYDNLMFSPRQMTSLSLPESAKINMSVTIGSSAKKPLKIKIPLMIGGMAYGLAMSEEAKVALARASKKLGTAANSGEGPFLPEEPGESGKFVLQVCCWSWGARTNKQIAFADMLEVKMGQGADVGVSRIEAAEFTGRARVLGGLAPDEPAIVLNAPPGIEKPEDWPRFIEELRQRANGIPIGLKIMATDRLEEELAMAVALGFDAIVIDGCEGGSHATAPIKQDDFGIPSLHALVRAKRFLQDSQMSLIISGGYFTPGQCLKALALGADAIYLATVPLFALGHNQIPKVAPWEPPTTLIYYNSPTKTQLDVDQAATSVANVLTAMVLEMEEAMRALGKKSLKELSAKDLVALDDITARITGVKSVFDKPIVPAIITKNNNKEKGQQAKQKSEQLSLEELKDEIGIQEFTKAIELNPKYILAHFGLGLAYEKKGLYQDAIRAYGKVVENANLPQDKSWVESAQDRIKELGEKI